VQKTLFALLELQEVDNRLDELMDERGDLPVIVDELKTKLKTKKRDLGLFKNQLTELKKQNAELQKVISESQSKMKKYEEQLYLVKTNKEYDAITSETEQARKHMETGKKSLESVNSKIEDVSEKILMLTEEIKNMDQELESNSIELESKMQTTQEEENMLMQERKIVLGKLLPQVVKQYELVRKARNGQGIALVQNNVCGGCYSYIPPQKIAEVRKMKEIHTCEACGRILVWDTNKN
jgi:predicted  nucleic acid-binding Zn-ribbon protein